MEYKINPNECARKNELPRLIQHAVINHASTDPIIKNLELEFEKLKPQYPNGHKKTIEEIKKELGFLDFKKELIGETRNELLERYKKESEYHSLALQDICKKCPQNIDCTNYQTYLNKTINSSVVDN